MATDTTNNGGALSKKEPIAIGSRGLQLTTFDEMYRMAECVRASGLAPEHFKETAQIVVAIQYGLEIGMSPIQALQSLYVIKGRPTLWGDALVALVRSSGKCKYIKETVEGDNEKMVAICETQRADESEPVIRRFSWADAKRARLDQKDTYKQYPSRMLATKARAYCLRDAYADVLRGLNVAEEVETYESTLRPHVESKPVLNLDAIPDEPADDAIDAEVEAESDRQVALAAAAEKAEREQSEQDAESLF